MKRPQDRSPGSRLAGWFLGQSDPEPPPRVDQLLGWRLWRVRDGRLLSWGVRHEWEPGTNEATCLGSRRCDTSPGAHCSCGFWALHSPQRCVRYARDTITDRTAAIGVVRAWGEVALHGDEGFRARYASPVCLFSDWLWEMPPLPRTGGGRPGWLERLQRALTVTDPGLAPAGNREPFLRRTASAYAVPVLSFHDALRSGFLAELGAGDRALRELRGLAGRLPAEERSWGADPAA